MMIWVYSINIILIIAVVCFQRKDPIVAIAWVLCFIVLPILGPVIYLVFGVGLKKRTKKKYLEKLNSSLEFSTGVESVEPSDEYKNIINFFKNTSHSVLTDNNTVEIFTDAEKKYERLFRDIENAKETVNLLYFIVHNDSVGRRLIRLLERKADEGVEIRFLYDGFGSLLTHSKAFKNLKSKNCGHVAAFFPIRLFSYSLINHRNHRKIAVIDGSIAYLGGMNIGDEYMGKKKPSPWRDTHMRITGEAVSEIQRIFCLDWEFTTGEKLTDSKELFFKTENLPETLIPMQIVASGPDSKMEDIKCGMLKMISEAKDYIYIQTPYFAPDKAFMDALKIAAMSGVNIEIMIPAVPDKKYVYYTTVSYMEELLKIGVKVYLYPGFIHSKTIVCDDKISTIGTTNIDTRSFLLHFEVNAFIYHSETAIENRNIFISDREISKELTIEEYMNRGILNIMKEGFFRLFAPIM